MGRIAKILSFTRRTLGSVKFSDVKVDPDGGSNITAPHYSAPGDDSVPLATDSALLVSTQATGAFGVAGYNDPKNEQKTGPGEKRIYSRDAGGAEVADIWLKDDGTIIATNAGGSIELKVDGTLNVIANTKMTFTAPNFEFIGNILVTGALVLNGIFSAFGGGPVVGTGGLSMTGGDVDADGISLKTHTHPAGTPPGNTGGPQ